MRPDLHTWAMSVAVLTAQRTTCIRRAVGCVLLNDLGHIIATGNNGVARGMPHCNEVVGFYPHACKGHDLPPGQDKCEAIHAEVNAIMQAGDVTKIHACYVTLSPCLACTKILLNTSCHHIYALEQWSDPASEELWTRAGRLWHRYQFPEDHDIIHHRS